MPIESLLRQWPRVCGSSLRIKSIFTPPTPLHTADRSCSECASNASISANTIVKVADDLSSFQVANVFQEALKSKAQAISTTSIPYKNLDSNLQYPNIQSQPIILGFSLPPYYFSCTASTKVVVNVFCQLVSFVREHGAWDKYATRSTSTDYALARVCDSLPISSFRAHLDTKTFRELERCWSTDQGRNQDLFRSFGPSMCADLVKVSSCHPIHIHGNTLLDFVGIVSGTSH